MKKNALDKLLDDMWRLAVHAGGGDIAFKPHIYVHELEYAINEERKKHFNQERFDNKYIALDTFRLETGIHVYAGESAGQFIHWLFDKISDTKQSPSSEEIKPGEAIIDTICKALKTVQNNLIGDEHRMVGNIIHSIKSEWGQRRARHEGL